MSLFIYLRRALFGLRSGVGGIQLHSSIRFPTEARSASSFSAASMATLKRSTKAIAYRVACGLAGRIFAPDITLRVTPASLATWIAVSKSISINIYGILTGALFGVNGSEVLDARR